jgi:hypothetical protein
VLMLEQLYYIGAVLSNAMRVFSCNLNVREGIREERDGPRRVLKEAWREKDWV